MFKHANLMKGYIYTCALSREILSIKFITFYAVVKQINVI